VSGIVSELGTCSGEWRVWRLDWIGEWVYFAIDSGIDSVIDCY
jgi:hypothetical protein